MINKKKIFLIIIAVILILSTSFIFYLNYLPNPHTNLEFWVVERVKKGDFKDCSPKYGMFGGDQYYGSEYIPEITEGNMQIDPEYCVIYTVTAYPDYMFNNRYVTGIYITDPKIEIYGLTINSSKEDIIKTLKKKGFIIKEGNGVNAKRGKFTINFYNNSISIRAEKSNIMGIQF